jgi:hypothetical protein
MAMHTGFIKELNSGKLTPDVLGEFSIDLTKAVREGITQKFHRDKMNDEMHKFSEFILIETYRSILRMPPQTLYLYLRENQKLRETLKLKYLKTHDQYADFNSKRKYLKRDFGKVMKRNLKSKDLEYYILDTTIVEVDINKYRKGRNIKNGKYDVGFIHSSTKGTTVGFMVAALINFSNLSVVDVQIFEKGVKKTDMWKEMVLDNLGTTAGKIKMVLADAGFFAYDNYTLSPNMRVVPVIKSRAGLENKVEEKLKNLSPNLMWFDQRRNEELSVLLEEFKEMIAKSIEEIKNYKNYAAVLRSRIEILFKIAKSIFGMNELHVYYKKFAIWNIYMILYISSIMYQYIEINGLNVHKTIELLKMKNWLF